MPAPTTSSTSTDVNALAAIHHPVRRRLLELLHLNGPATVSQLAAASGERIGNASHHLKVLGEAGLVEIAPELAKDRRETWWRSVPRSMSWSIADVADDPVAATIAAAAEQQNLAHHISKVKQWHGRRDEYAETWIRAAFVTDSWINVTASELAELGDRITALIGEYANNDETGATEPAPGDERQRVYVFAHGMPAKP